MSSLKRKFGRSKLAQTIVGHKAARLPGCGQPCCTLVSVVAILLVGIQFLLNRKTARCGS